jgi:hypothetical protein
MQAIAVISEDDIESVFLDINLLNKNLRKPSELREIVMAQTDNCSVAASALNPP